MPVEDDAFQMLGLKFMLPIDAWIRPASQPRLFSELESLRFLIAKFHAFVVRFSILKQLAPACLDSLPKSHAAESSEVLESWLDSWATEGDAGRLDRSSRR